MLSFEPFQIQTTQRRCKRIQTTFLRMVLWNLEYRECERAHRRCGLPTVKAFAQNPAYAGYAFQYRRYAGLEEIRRSGRQVYRKSVVGRELKILRLRCIRTCCRPSHNVCSAGLYAPGAGSYIVRVPSRFWPRVCRGPFVCV